MTQIKLVDGTIINADDVNLAKGILRISTKELTVEELANLFNDKENTSLLVLMTESGIETGYKTGFTSFAGINYDAEGVKTVELFQPIDNVEARIANVEGNVNLVNQDLDYIRESTAQNVYDVAAIETTVNALLGV